MHIFLAPHTFHALCKFAIMSYLWVTVALFVAMKLRAYLKAWRNALKDSMTMSTPSVAQMNTNRAAEHPILLFAHLRNPGKSLLSSKGHN